jgi:5'-3' exonuclease
MRRTRLVSAREGGAAGRDDGGYAAGVKTLYLIDGHAAFFRAYYAIRGRMTSPITREPTNAVFGFVAMLTKLMREQRPDYLAVVIDVGGDHATFRSELYPEYKMNRDPAPDDFHPQVERCLEILDAMQIPVIGIPGVEADDVIATIAREHAGEGGTAEEPIRIRIVSKDKDLMQILADGVEMFDSSSGDVLDVDGLMEKHGIAPEQVIDMLALAGDTVDNVPGVKGIGPKTAAKLIAEWGSLDALLENIDQIKGKRRENIEAARDQLPLSRELVTLRTDVETGFELARARLEPEAIPFDAVETLCQELGLNRLRNELAELTGRSTAEAQEAVAEPPKPKRGDDAAGGLFAGRKQKTFDEVPLDQGGALRGGGRGSCRSNCGRARWRPSSKAMGLGSLFDDVEMPLVEVLAELEYNGILVDARRTGPAARAARGGDRSSWAQIEDEAMDDKPADFNPDSPKQLATVLFNKPEDEEPGLGLKPIKKTRPGLHRREVLQKLDADPDDRTPIPR